jgi:hypothetical protein
MITMIDADKVRAKRDPGRCYRRAGFNHVGYTKGGLWVFQLLPDAMPKACPPVGVRWREQLRLEPVQTGGRLAPA